MVDRVDWEVFWMTMVMAVAQKSVDPSTKHGCILVSPDNHFISMGYNSFPKKCLDDKLPLTRPEKYKVIIHSETNAIINSERKDTTGATAYITGYPCTNCFSNMINANISKIVYGPVGSYMLKQEDIDLINLLNVDADTLEPKIKIVKYEKVMKSEDIKDFLNIIINYFDEKVNYKNVING